MFSVHPLLLSKLEAQSGDLLLLPAYIVIKVDVQAYFCT